MIFWRAEPCGEPGTECAANIRTSQRIGLMERVWAWLLNSVAGARSDGACTEELASFFAFARVCCMHRFVFDGAVPLEEPLASHSVCRNLIRAFSAPLTDDAAASSLACLLEDDGAVRGSETSAVRELASVLHFLRLGVAAPGTATSLGQPAVLLSGLLASDPHCPAEAGTAQKLMHLALRSTLVAQNRGTLLLQLLVCEAEAGRAVSEVKEISNCGSFAAFLCHDVLQAAPRGAKVTLVEKYSTLSTWLQKQRAPHSTFTAAPLVKRFGGASGGAKVLDEVAAKVELALRQARGAQ